MKILVISPIASPPATNGAKRRILNLLNHLRSAGHSIHYVYTGLEEIDTGRAVELMSEVWDSVHLVPESPSQTPSLDGDFGIDDWSSSDAAGVIGNIAAQIDPDIALVNYVFQSRYLDVLPDRALKILDTHDKLSRASLYREAGLEPGFFHTTEPEEIRGLARADVVLAIQDGESDYFRQAGRPVVIVGDVCDKRFVDRRYGALRHIGFLAAYNKFNLYSLERFLPEFVRYAEQSPHPIELHLAGNLASGARRSIEDGLLDHPSVVNEGFVDDLADFYERMDLMINPTLIGTGLKIKTVEALSHGVPLLSTAIGFDGLPALHPHHALENEKSIIAALDGILVQQQGDLTRLSNISRSVFTEYQLNLRRNIDAVFSERLVRAKREGGDLERLLGATTGRLADTGSPAYRTVYDAAEPPARIRIAHVVNPVDLPPGSDLYLAQPLTFESMRRARNFAADRADVELHAVGYPEDTRVFPHGFRHDDSLDRSILDVGEFAMPRKLPLLADVLERLYRNTDADYLIYTNVDIGLQPHFYTFVADRIAQGHEAFVINRRTLPKRYADVSDLDSIFSDYGRKHPGYDCFVFPRRLYEQFRLGHICIGVHLIGRALLWNLMAHARGFAIFREEHVTFHIGDDNTSKDIRQLDFIRHNTYQALDILESLERERGLLSQLQKTGQRDLLSMDFGRALLRQKNSAADASGQHQAGRPVMIHALFRTGSTYLWQKLRGIERLHCYYEPLHEELAYFSHDDLEVHKNRHSPGRFHERNQEAWFFAEFEGLIPETGRGVLGYHREMAYDGFAANEPDPRLHDYIDGLLRNTQGRRPVLQFNRSALRQQWFREAYPDAYHVYLVRDPASQWASYTRFFTPARRGFSRNDAIIAGKNLDRPLIRPLNNLVPLVPYAGTHDFFKFYDAVFDQYDWPERYALFYYLWLTGLVEGCRSSDLVIDMLRLTRNAAYRLRVEFEFLCLDIPLNLEDADIAEREPDPELVDPARRDAIERQVHALVARSFGADWFAPLQQRGFESLHARIDQDLRAADQLLRDLPDAGSLAQRRDDIERLARQELEAAGGQQTRDDRPVMSLRGAASGGEAADGIHFSGGWSWNEGRQRWMEAKGASLTLALPAGLQVPALRLQMRTHEVLASRDVTMTLSCDGCALFQGRLGADPRWYTVRLDQLPGAARSAIRVDIEVSEIACADPGDDRMLSGCLLDADVVDLAALPELEDALPADAAEAIDLHRIDERCLTGDWSWPEEGFRWIAGAVGALRIDPGRRGKWRRLRLRAHRYGGAGAAAKAKVEIWLGGQLLMAPDMRTRPRWYEATVPDTLAAQGEPLPLTIIAPETAGAADDPRALTVAVWSIELRN